MNQATVRLDSHHHVGPIDRRIFGGFAEHLGRCVYEGIYDPGSPHADERGFRKDVLEALKRLDMPIMRYPGGNFVSAYDWKDGIGPREERPRRLDFAWESVETNQFGTDEFMEWAKELGTEPMMAVNLGTAGAKEAAELLEYCNLPTGTKWADLRAKHGSKEPYGVKLWCMGNEMDGPWQAGHVPADEYARRARQASHLMKGLDKSIETVACGSSSNGMATYLDYDRVTLEYCWDTVDYISAHKYSNNKRGDSAWFLAEGVEISRILEDYAGLLDYVRGVKKSDKRVYVSFDEWNVWYHSMEVKVDPWQEAPPILEDQYNLEDALVCAQYMSAFVRRADVVKVACIAQIVNVIAPILTKKDGLLLQPIFYPFELFSRLARGNSLRPSVSSPTYEAGERGEVPTLDVSASHDEASGTVSVFLINRDQAGEAEVTIDLEDLKVESVVEATVLGGGDVKATNTWEQPETVVPRQAEARVGEGGTSATVRVPSPGFAAVKLRVSRR